MFEYLEKKMGTKDLTNGMEELFKNELEINIYRFQVSYSIQIESIKVNKV